MISAGSRPSVSHHDRSTASLCRTVARRRAGCRRRRGAPPAAASAARPSRRRGSGSAPAAAAGSTWPRHGDRPALEARRARAPHQRQQLQRVLEPREALAQRRELPAVERVLALEPARAEPAQRAPAGDDVERRHQLRQVREVAVGDAGDQRAEPDPRRHAREVAERRVALEHVLPLAPDLRDLDEVVHQPQRAEARVLGRARDVRQRRRGRAPPSRSARSAARTRAPAAPPPAAPPRPARPGTRAARARPAPPPPRPRSPRRAARPNTSAASRSWAATTFGGTGAPRAAVALAHDLLRHVERHRVGGHARVARPAPARPRGASPPARSCRPPS